MNILLKSKQTLFVIILSLSFVVTGHAQRSQKSYTIKPGKIYYKNGKVEEGKLTFNNKVLKIKLEGKKKKLIKPNLVDWFQTITKRGKTKNYSYANVSKNKKRSLFKINELHYDGDGIRVWKNTGDKPARAGVGILTVEIKMYYIQRQGERYATLVSGKKGLRKYFEDCPSLVEKIGTSGYKPKNMEAIAKFYESECE